MQLKAIPFILLALIFASTAHAAVILDTVVSTSTGQSGSGKTLLLPVTVTSTANRVLVVTVGVHDSNECNHQTLGLTFGGVAMTQLVNADDGCTGQTRSEIWYMMNPPSGLNNASMTYDFLGFVALGAYDFTGVNASPTIFAAQTSTSQVTITPNTNNNTIIDVITSESAMTASSTQTQEWVEQKQSFENSASSLFAQGTAGAKTMAWTSVGSFPSQAAVAVAPIPAVSSAPTQLSISNGTLKTSQGVLSIQ